MVPDYCTKYEQHQPILLCDITTNTQKCVKKWKLITQLWQKSKYYFTSLSNASYMITVSVHDNCNKYDKKAHSSLRYHNIQYLLVVPVGESI